MNFKFLKFLFFIVFIPHFLTARQNQSVKDTTLPHNFIEVGYGTGIVNSRLTMAAGIINVGYKHVIVTARLCRSSGSEFDGYIFEDAFLMGYRFGFCKFFNATFSAGYSDLAFERGYHTYFNATPDMFNKARGYSFESEVEFKISSKKKISPLSLSAIYYSTFNPEMNLNGVVLALKFSFDRFGEHWYDKPSFPME